MYTLYIYTVLDRLELGQCQHLLVGIKQINK